MADASKIEEAVDSINAISQFISHEQIKSWSDAENILFQPFDQPAPSDDTLRDVHVIVHCGSSVLSITETVLSTLKHIPALNGRYDIILASCMTDMV